MAATREIHAQESLIMRFGMKSASALGVIASAGLIAASFAATPSETGSGAPMQPGPSTTMPSNQGPMNNGTMTGGEGSGAHASAYNSQSPSSPSASATTPSSGGSAMNGTSAMDSAQADPSKLSKDQIKAVQQALNVKDDGVWGSQSVSALKQWQQQNGLPVTGQLDPQTKQKLNVPG
jgi:hypothetical protein